MTGHDGTAKTSKKVATKAWRGRMGR